MLLFLGGYLFSLLWINGPVGLAQQVPPLEFTAEDLEYLQKDQYFRDALAEATVCAAQTSSTGAGATTPTGKNTFVIGDSLTLGKVKGGSYLEKLEQNGFTLDTDWKEDPDNDIRVFSQSAEATGGITAAGTKSRLEQRLSDPNDGLPRLKSANIVVIALGTNGDTDALNTYTSLATYIKSLAPAASIYWVNTYYTKGRATTYSEVNQIILQAAQQANFSVIDFAKGVEDKLVPGPGGDGIHYNLNDTSPSYSERSDFIVKKLADIVGNATPSTSQPGTCFCSDSSNIGTLNQAITWGAGPWGDGAEVYKSGESAPYSLETWAIHVLKNIAKKAGVPEETMVTQFKVIALVAWTKAEGGGVGGRVGSYNPLNTKNNTHRDLEGVDQDSDGNPGTDNNSSGYPTFDQGVEAITRGLFNTSQKRIGSALLNPNLTADGLEEAIAGDFYAEPYGSKNWKNRLEDIFPGEKAYATLSITGYDHGVKSLNNGLGDREFYLNIKRSVLERMWTPEGYIEQASKVLDGSNRQPPSIKNVDASSLKFTPTTPGIPGGTDPGGCVTRGGGSVDISGYSFPLAPQTKAVGGIRPGMTVADAFLESTHHDETPAFDLFSTKGADVYAIRTGIVVKANKNFKGIEGCGSIQLKGDDTFFYWYGHLRNVLVNDGDKVIKGEKIAEVADKETYTLKCTDGGGDHLHIDRGCTTAEGPQWGGDDLCRDPEFIPLLSSIYERLPER
jgi:hypothetical protein